MTGRWSTHPLKEVVGYPQRRFSDISEKYIGWSTCNNQSNRPPTQFLNDQFLRAARRLRYRSCSFYWATVLLRLRRRLARQSRVPLCRAIQVLRENHPRWDRILRYRGHDGGILCNLVISKNPHHVHNPILIWNKISYIALRFISVLPDQNTQSYRI